MAVQYQEVAQKERFCEWINGLGKAPTRLRGSCCTVSGIFPQYATYGESPLSPTLGKAAVFAILVGKGMIPQSSISRRTQILVVGCHPDARKIAEAQKRGLDIIDFDDLERIGGGEMRRDHAVHHYMVNADEVPMEMIYEGQ